MNITITQGKGFHLNFDNGWVLSIQVGEFNYCANRDIHFEDRLDSGRSASCPDAEIAVWHKEEHGMLHLGADTVAGWVPGNTVLKVVNYLNRTKLGNGRRLQVGRQLAKILRANPPAE